MRKPSHKVPHVRTFGSPLHSLRLSFLQNQVAGAHDRDLFYLEQHLFRIKNLGKETNRPKKCIYFLLRTEEYFAFYRTLNRVYSIIIDLIILNNYIGAQNIRITDEVIFFQVTDPGLRPHKLVYFRCLFLVYAW